MLLVSIHTVPSRRSGRLSLWPARDAGGGPIVPLARDLGEDGAHDVGRGHEAVLLAVEDADLAAAHDAPQPAHVVDGDARVLGAVVDDAAARDVLVPEADAVLELEADGQVRRRVGARRRPLPDAEGEVVLELAPLALRFLERLLELDRRLVVGVGRVRGREVERAALEDDLVHGDERLVVVVVAAALTPDGRGLCPRRFSTISFLCEALSLLRRRLGDAAGYVTARRVEEGRVCDFEEGGRQYAKEALRSGEDSGRRAVLVHAERRHHGRRYPRSQKVHPPTNAVRHSKSGGKGVDCAGRVREKGEFGDL